MSKQAMSIKRRDRSPREVGESNARHAGHAEFLPDLSGSEDEELPQAAEHGGRVNSSEVRAELWRDKSCTIRVVGDELFIELGDDYPYILQVRRPKASDEDERALAGLVAGAVSEISRIAYVAGRRDAKSAMMDAV